jgi:hypothetical protein
MTHLFKSRLEGAKVLRRDTLSRRRETVSERVVGTANGVRGRFGGHDVLVL